MKERIGKILIYMLVGAVILISLFPLYIVCVMGSWKNDDLMRSLPYFFSDYFLENVKNVIRSNYLRSYMNSIVVSAASVVLCVLSAALFGYGVTKYEFRGKKVLSTFVIVVMMVPNQVSIIGYLMQMRAMGLNNSLWAIIVCWIANPFAGFFMMQFMKGSVPDEILESARIDGAGEIRVFASIARPFIMPAIASVSILIFLWSWNNYLLPLVVVNDNKNLTLPLFVNNLGSEYRDDIGARMAAMSLALAPLIVVFCVFSKSFIKGIAAGALKG